MDAPTNEDIKNIKSVLKNLHELNIQLIGTTIAENNSKVMAKLEKTIDLVDKTVDECKDQRMLAQAEKMMNDNKIQN